MHPAAFRLKSVFHSVCLATVKKDAALYSLFNPFNIPHISSFQHFSPDASLLVPLCFTCVFIFILHSHPHLKFHDLYKFCCAGNYTRTCCMLCCSHRALSSVIEMFVIQVFHFNVGEIWDS